MFTIQGFLTCQLKLPMNYQHLSQSERGQIYALMKADHDPTQFVKLLACHKSTISQSFCVTEVLKAIDLNMPVSYYLQSATNTVAIRPR